MSDARRRLGQFGERVAVAHLESKGYRILARNYRCPDGEVDIIAEDGGCLVFVEVRTRRGDAMGTAVESLTLLKGARISATAEAYCEANPDAPEERRIDVIAVDLTPSGRLLRLEHIENAFSADELPELSRR
jgi:putative endonuclease